MADAPSPGTGHTDASLASKEALQVQEGGGRSRSKQTLGGTGRCGLLLAACSPDDAVRVVLHTGSVELPNPQFFTLATMTHHAPQNMSST